MLRNAAFACTRLTTEVHYRTQRMLYKYGCQGGVCMPIPSSNLPANKNSHDRIIAAIESCLESSGIEFKESMPWDQSLGSIVRTSLAMANHNGGGLIVVGVAERDGHWSRRGIKKEHLETYEPDVVVDTINSYASPFVSCELLRTEHADKTYLSFIIREFEDTPVIAKKRLPTGKTEAGTILLRPAGKPQTTAVRHAQDLHYLLNLSAEKRARQLLEASRRLSLEPRYSGENVYRQELKRYKTRIQGLSEVPHWVITFQPEESEKERVRTLRELQDIVEACHISHTGWPYPVFLNRPDILHRGNDFCSGAWEGTDKAEEWVLFQSLQFRQRLAIEGGHRNYQWDTHRRWADQHDNLLELSLDDVPGFIGIERTIQTICFALEFALRVAGKAQLAGAIRFKISINSANGLVLNADPNRHWMLQYRISADSLEFSSQFDLLDMVSDRVPIATGIARHFFERMGWDPTDEMLAISVRKTLQLE